jgi:hypothetical protein
VLSRAMAIFKHPWTDTQFSTKSLTRCGNIMLRQGKGSCGRRVFCIHSYFRPRNFYPEKATEQLPGEPDTMQGTIVYYW